MRTALATLMIVCATQAAAQNCRDREGGEEVLRSQYGETVQSYGLDTAGNVVEMWANLETGTWTLTASTAAGLMCAIGAGDNYAAVNEPQGVDG